MREPDPVPHDTCYETPIVGRFLHIPRWSRNDDINHGRSYLDDDEESDHGAQADEEPLAGSRVRTGLVNVDTGATRRRSAVVSGASRRSLIEDDEARRHSMPVMMRPVVCSFILFFFSFFIEIMTLRYRFFSYLLFFFASCSSNFFFLYTNAILEFISIYVM